MSEDNEQTYQQVAGLSFLAPDSSQSGFGGGLRCFGQLLKKPQFIDTDGFADAIATMDRVTLRPVDVDGTEVENFRAVKSLISGKIYAMPSNEYQAVNDGDVAKPLLAEAQSRKLVTIGRTDGIGTGRTVAHVMIGNPEFRIRLLKGYDDDVMLGVKWTNSYNGAASVRGEVFGVRMVCVNYNIWAQILGEFNHKHTGKMLQQDWVQEQFAHLIKGALDKSPILRGKVEMAFNTVIAKVDVEDLLWGIKLPPTHVAEVMGNFHVLVPEMKQQGLNGWTLYNAVTAFLTYKPSTATTQYHTMYDRAKSAVDLLTKSHDSIIEKGRKRREEWEEAQKQAAKATQKVAVKLAAKARKVA